MVAVSVVIPTLEAGEALEECLAALDRQSFRDFETIVIDNSGRGAVARAGSIHNRKNVGFGAAINQGWRRSRAEYIAALNDDAVPAPEWLGELVSAAAGDSSVGMCASKVIMADTGTIDSAGMLIARDGSSKQRGHGAPCAEYDGACEALLPSGSAALYRRSMLEEVGGFAEEYFLYCEDTDLGLRARRRGWKCRYVPTAVVEHRYSHSAGRVSALKAYLVERNRLWTLIRNFSPTCVVSGVAASAVRYFWHGWFVLTGRGAAAQYAETGNAFALVWFVVKAHAVTLLRLPALLAQRRGIQRHSAISNAAFDALLAEHSITLKQVAAL